MNKKRDKPGKCYNKQRHKLTCNRKVKHPTQEEAQTVAKLYYHVEAYKCLWCHFWHTGHIWGLSKRVRESNRE